MNIAYLLDWVGDPRTGVPRKVQGQVLFWEKYGCKVEVIAVVPQKYHQEWSNISKQIFGYKSKFGRIAARVRASIYLIKSKDFDFVYRRVSIWELFEIISMFFVPTVLEINTNNMKYFKNKSRLLSTIHTVELFFVSRLAIGACAVTNELVNQQRPILKNKSKAFTNSVDILGAKLLPLVKVSGKTSFVFVGSESFLWNGLDRINLLAKTFPEYEFHMVGISGTGPKNIIWHPAMYGEELLRFFEQIDFGLSTLSIDEMDLFEAAPLKSRHYLAHGLPVVGAYIDSALDSQANFYFQLKFDKDNQAILNKDELSVFIEKWTGLRVQKSELNCIDSNYVEKERIKFFEHLITKQTR